MASATNGNEDTRPEDQIHPYYRWKHTPRLHTCQHCDRIVVTHHELKHCLVSLPHTKSEALHAEADDCPVFCMLNETLQSFASYPHGLRLDFFRFLFDPNYPKRGLYGTESTANSSRIAAQKKARSNNIAKLLWRTQFVLGNLRRQHFNLFVSPEGLYVLHGITAIDCEAQLERLEGREGEIDLDGDLFRHVLCRNFDTREVYANLKTFISSCLSSHEACQISPIGFVPSRLLEVSPDSDPNHIRLVEAISDGQKTWASLSYVWGGDQSHKTTRSILPEYLKIMYLDVLPQTIKDAVSVCRELGIAYLWIDSFCIVQDDEADKAREIPQMALIYRYALLTIAASSAHTVDEGFLHHGWPLCYQRFPPTGLRFRDSCGRESKVVVLNERRLRSVFHGPVEPIDERAWALQEQLLSPRLLSYTSHGPRWSCRCLLQYVNGHPDRTSLPRYTNGHNYASQILPCIPGLEMLRWESVVELYSPRQSTLPYDKLVALSAVARSYSENSQERGTYLAGIWKNSLPLGLMWAAVAENKRPRPLEYRAPSWSWASVDGVVHYYYHINCLKFDDDFKIISAQTRTVNSNEFGAVTAGMLVVDARVRDCRVGKKSKNCPPPPDHQFFNIFDGPEMEFYADTLEFWTLICNEVTEVTLLVVAVADITAQTRIGLVLVKNDDGNSFSRVAYFESIYHGKKTESRREYEAFFEGFEIKRVIIV